MTEPTSRDLSHLREAEALRYGCIDLRFEGGPWLAELDALVTCGWLESRQHEPDYMIGYTLTPMGRSILEATSREEPGGQLTASPLDSQ